MKIEILNREDIDIKKWNNCIATAHNGLIYAYSWYLDITTEKSWKALISPNYEYIMPFAVNKKFSFSYIYQPFFTQQSGVFSKIDIDTKTIIAFKLILENKYKYINTNFNFANTLPEGKETSQKTNYVLSLSSEYETLRKSFSKNHIRNINKSYKNGLSITYDISINDVILFKKQNLKNNLSERNLNTLRSILKYCSNTKVLKIYGVSFKKELVAISVFSSSHNRYYNLISASNNTGFGQKASFFLFNEFIKDHAGENAVLDFEGSMIPGIARFFLGWGATNEPYYNLKQNKLPLPFRLFKK